jgi:hypothetical protein
LGVTRWRRALRDAWRRSILFLSRTQHPFNLIRVCEGRVHRPIDGDSECSAAIPGCIGCRLEACATKRTARSY